MHFRIAPVLCAAALVGCGGDPGPAPRAVVAGPARPPADWPFAARARPATGRHAMVVSGHPLATQVGLDVLRRGGNAVDATVAVALALAVVLPEAGNLGGGGFLVLREAGGAVAALDFRETAPAGATPDMFVDAAGRPTDGSVHGHLASGVPGTVAGLAEVHRRFGRLAWAELVAPALRLAGEGHVVDATRAALLADHAAKLGAHAASRAQFLPRGRAPHAGQLWRQPDLARTLALIAREGPDAFYRGPIAALLAAEMERGGGLITAADLAAYRARWRRPLALTYRGHTIYTMPPPSGGGVTLAILLNIMEGFDTLPPFGSPALLHLETEAMRWAYAARNAYVGDPGFANVPTALLVDKRYSAARRAAIQPGRAGGAGGAAPLAGGDREGTETIHIAVVDPEGNAVSATTTINDLFGSGVTVTGAGFLLNDEMDDFTTAPGRATHSPLSGVVQGAANAIAPGKRMLSSMTPAIVLDPAGAPLLLVGARGGTRITSSVYHVIANVLDHGMALARAVAAPRTHYQGQPDSIEVERGGVSRAVLDSLARWGHATYASPTIAQVNAILRTPEGWVGVADPRGGSAAAGW